LPYDRVSLLIGVNNQYRGREVEPYRFELNGLIQRAVGYAGGRKDEVFLVSIPDWGVTPFAEKRDIALIAQQIDQYNEAMHQEAKAHGLNWIDITPISRRKSVQSDWIAPDGLHPGPSMYQAWVEKIRETIPQ
jgi:lysophospholipase L1-like esterase